MPCDHALREPEQDAGEARHPDPAGEHRNEADGHDQAHEGHDENVGGEAGDAYSVEVDHHGERQADLDDGGDDGQLINEKQHTGGRGDSGGGEAGGNAEAEGADMPTD